MKHAPSNTRKSPRVIIGEPEIMKVTPDIQKKMDELGKLVAKIFDEKL